MASEWPSFAKQKIFLASALIEVIEHQDTPSHREASVQGAVLLLDQARKILLALIAEQYQKQEQPGSIDELASLIGSASAEINEIRELQGKPDSWWHHIDALLTLQQRPGARKQSAADDDMIVVAAENGPERSVAALQRTTRYLKRYLETVIDRHDEW
jgi:predicted transcriptional regulator